MNHHYGPQQPFNPDGHVLVATGGSRMRKRRRTLESHNEQPQPYAHPHQQPQHQKQQQQQQQHHAPLRNISDGLDAASSHYSTTGLPYAASGASGLAELDVSCGADQQHQQPQAHAQLDSAGAPSAPSDGVTILQHQPCTIIGRSTAHATPTYPEFVPQHQLPYFTSGVSAPSTLQQTDPATYTVPWPPSVPPSLAAASAGAAIAAAVPDDHTTAPFTSGSRAVSSVPNPVMPFFPEKATAEPVIDASIIPPQPFGQVDACDEYALDDSKLPNGTEPAAPTVSSTYMDDASMHLKLQSLPILDNLAAQLIHTISRASYPQIQDLVSGRDDEDGQAYKTLKDLFDQTRKVYSRDTPFIDAIFIQMFQPAQQEVIRKANIATFISSILGAHDVGFFHLNEFFLETFVPLGHRLLKWQGAIFLELKTQTYISALMNSESPPQAMLDELFPHDLDSQILTRHPDAPSLSPSEQDFIDRSRARKNYLLEAGASEEALRDLPKKYQWSDFVREFALCINKNVDGILNSTASRTQGTALSDRRTSATAKDANGTQPPGASTVNGIEFPAIPSLLQQQATSGEKRSTTGSTTIRQPWTKTEEDALLLGLEKVNGPHWSQILALYGRGGSESEVLKDRNQVQLKDKARNLKLWYLKMGREVPVALRGVTGKLEKRGGARAKAALGLMDEPNGNGADGDDEDAEVAEQDDAAAGPEKRSVTAAQSSKKKKKPKK